MFQVVIASEAKQSTGRPEQDDRWIASLRSQ